MGTILVVHDELNSLELSVYKKDDRSKPELRYFPPYMSKSFWEEYIITFRNSIALITTSQIRTMTGKLITGMEANESTKQNTDN